MGVKGLKSFIENNKEIILKDYHLHDTYLVIDGNNLQFALYFRSSQKSNDYIYGGDYVHYAALCRQFFTSLLKCNVKPIVIFDGGLDESMNKFKTVMGRFHQRFHCVRRISYLRFNRENKICPLLTRKVFEAVLNELKIRHVQSLFEADMHIAMIANQLKCPVLSNDSDFLVFDLEGGLIITDLVDFTWTVNIKYDEDKTVLYKYVACSIYYIDNLIEFFPGLKKHLMPLFSTLMGNDYVEKRIFENIFNGIPNVNQHRKTRNLINIKRHEDMIRLLNWLKDKQSVDEAMQELIKFIKGDSRQNAQQLLEISLENYQKGKMKSHLIKYLNLDKVHSNDINYYGDANASIDLPEWFIIEFHKSFYVSFVIDVITQKICLLTPQINDFQLSSSHMCSKRMRQCLYGLLRLNHNDCTEITEYDRKNRNIEKVKIQPQLTINGQVLPCMNIIRTLKPNQLRLLFLDILKTDETFLEKIKHELSPHVKNPSYIEKLQVLIIVIRHWIGEALFHVIWIEFIYALIINIMFSGHLDTSVKIKFIELDKIQVQKAVMKLCKYWTRPVHSLKSPFEPRIVHYFVEMQNCMSIMLPINSLLGSPFNLANFPFYCFNGNFIYNLTQDFTSRSDPQLYLSLLIGKESSFDIFNKILGLITDGFSNVKKKTEKKPMAKKVKNVQKSKSSKNNYINKFNALTLAET